MKTKALLLGLLWLALLPAQAQRASPPDTVKIGMFVNSIYDISMANGEYSASLWLWMVYKEDSLDMVKNFELMGSKSVEVISSSVEEVEGLQWVSVKLLAKMQEDWITHNFPFDTQKLVLKVENTLYDASQVVFVPDLKGTKIDRNFELGGWDISSLVLTNSPTIYETTYGDPSLSEDEGSEYSAVSLVITIKRQGWALLFKVFLGLYIALLISSLVFLVPANDLNSKFGLAIGGLFAAVGNKYIIDSVLPESNAFTLSDQIHALTFSFIFFYILSGVVVHEIHQRGREAFAQRIDRTLLWLAPLLYILINSYLIYRA
jgi:hypothetical protein